MNGPEHYKEAERLLGLAGSCDWTVEFAAYRDPALAAAQVHATLALVAAVANRSLIDGLMPALAPAPQRYEKDENGEYDFRFPWQEALR